MGLQVIFTKKILILFLVSLSIFLAGCGNSYDAAVTGFIDHPHNLTFPAGTVLTIQIMDITKKGSPGTQIAVEVIKDQEISIPTPFIVVYDKQKINPGHQYSLVVKVEDNTGKLIYTNEKEILVITKGYPVQGVDVFIVPYYG
jgi:uncharacterized lipoprotein YbaY